MRATECQDTPSHSSCYASGPNDIWSLGVILVNLTCGRNPWKRASMEDSTFRAYRTNPKFLSSILPLSREFEAILGRIFECDPQKRISIPELRNLILHCPRLTTHSSGAFPPTPPSEPQYMPEAPVNVLPECLQPLNQYSAIPSAPILPASVYPVTAQLSSSSKGSSYSDNGSTISEASSCSSVSSYGSSEEACNNQPAAYIPFHFQPATQCLQSYFQLDPVPGLMHPQPFLNPVPVC